jgi:hypothetical protein
MKEEGDHQEVIQKVGLLVTLEIVSHKVKEDQRVQEVVVVLVDEE